MHNSEKKKTRAEMLEQEHRLLMLDFSKEYAAQTVVHLLNAMEMMALSDINDGSEQCRDSWNAIIHLTQRAALITCATACS